MTRRLTPIERKRVLVAGATSRIGLLVDTLLARGHAVRAMTRHLDSRPAARLRRAGAEVVVGDFDGPTSLATACAGADTVFATGTAHRAGPEGELRHGYNLSPAAAASLIGEPAAVDSDHGWA
jgi:uncharacterized protein YbjT (DUF2867 family)